MIVSGPVPVADRLRCLALGMIECALGDYHGRRWLLSETARPWLQEAGISVGQIERVLAERGRRVA